MLLAATSFACVMSFTPGPNNILLTASGVNFGFVRSIPHILGVKFGFVALVAACGLGLGLLFTTYPVAQTVLKIVGAGYLLWLAWKVANAGSASGASGRRPPDLLPPGHRLPVGQSQGRDRRRRRGRAVHPPGQRHDGSSAAALHLRLCTILSATTWTAFGAALSTFLRNPRYARRSISPWRSCWWPVSCRWFGPDRIGQGSAAGGCRGQPSPLEARPRTAVSAAGTEKPDNG